MTCLMFNTPILMEKKVVLTFLLSPKGDNAGHVSSFLFYYFFSSSYFLYLGQCGIGNIYIGTLLIWTQILILLLAKCMTLRGVHRLRLPQLASLSLESNKQAKLPKSYLVSILFSFTVEPLVRPHTLCWLKLSSLFKLSSTGPLTSTH